MGMRGVERRLEGMVEGVLGRMFRSGVKPVELGRRVVRELDAGRTIDVRGRTVVPNDVTVRLADEDHEAMAGVADALIRELAAAVREHAREEGYGFVGPVAVHLARDESLRTGSFRVDVALLQGDGGAGPGSLALPDGSRRTLGDRTVVLGRHPECDVVLADTNVSRQHAELRPHDDGWMVVDLGSTNGIRVNDVPVSSQVLRDGDRVGIGNLTLVFEAS